MLAVVSFEERKVFPGGLGGWCKMCLVLLSRHVGGVEGPTEADLRRPWTAVCSHTPHEMVECWEPGNESAQKLQAICGGDRGQEVI